jgi:hypothetical protein
MNEGREDEREVGRNEVRESRIEGSQEGQGSQRN